MDPEVNKKLRAEINEKMTKILGPETPEFVDYFEKNSELLDAEAHMGPNTHIVEHYKLEGKFTIPKLIARAYFEARNIPFTKDDIFFTSYPKSGTTWLQMIGLHALYDCDVEKVKSVNVDLACPTLELPECTLPVLKQSKSPRWIKSHLPYSMLPLGNCNRGYKILHITRNPKDVSVSMYHFYKMMRSAGLIGDVKSLVNLFLNDGALYNPFDKHCLEYWEHRNDDNVLFLTYESLHKDTFNQVKRICEFLGKRFTDDQIRTIVQATTFDQMASSGNAHHAQWADNLMANTETSKFMRKGKIGDWKNHFDDELNKKFDEWIEKRLGHSDITFDYE